MRSPSPKRPAAKKAAPKKRNVTITSPSDPRKASVSSRVQAARGAAAVQKRMAAANKEGRKVIALQKMHDRGVPGVVYGTPPGMDWPEVARGMKRVQAASKKKKRKK